MEGECPDCDVYYDNDCAVKLCAAKGWKRSGNFVTCKCGYLLRAKTVRDEFFGGLIDSDKQSSPPANIYCERSSDGQGHV